MRDDHPPALLYERGYMPARDQGSVNLFRDRASEAVQYERVAAYRNDLAKAAESLSSLGAASADELSRLGAAWAELSPATVARRSASLRRFFGFLKNPKSLPAWEKPNMLAKYYVTTKGVELARQSQ